MSSDSDDSSSEYICNLSAFEDSDGSSLYTNSDGFPEFLDPNEEITRLKELNRALRYKVKALRGKVATLKSQARRENALWATHNTFTKPMRELPTEILTHILMFTVPPDCLLDHSLSYGLHSAWVQAQDAKLNLLLVSKAWYGAGIRLLYQRVVLRQYSQLLLLVRTFALSDGPHSLTEHVLSILVDCCVPDSRYLEFPGYLAELKLQCPNLRTLALGPSASFYPDLYRLFLGRKALLTEVTISERLILGADDLITEVISHLSDSLETLILGSWLTSSSTSNYTMSFPRLSTLIISRIRGQSSIQESFRSWSLPALRKLDFPCNAYSTGLQEAQSFFFRHGANIKALTLPGSWTDTGLLAGSPPNYPPLQTVLNHCPKLEHLRLLYSTPSNEVILTHENLQFIDVFGSTSDGELCSSPPSWGQRLVPSFVKLTEVDSEDPQEQPKVSYLPSLKMLRAIDERLTHLPEPPFPCNLHSQTNLKESYSLRYPGIAIESGSMGQHRCFVRQCEEEWSYELECELYGVPPEDSDEEEYEEAEDDPDDPFQG